MILDRKGILSMAREEQDELIDCDHTGLGIVYHLKIGDNRSVRLCKQCTNTFRLHVLEAIVAESIRSYLQPKASEKPEHVALQPMTHDMPRAEWEKQIKQMVVRG